MRSPEPSLKQLVPEVLLWNTVQKWCNVWRDGGTGKSKIFLERWAILAYNSTLTDRRGREEKIGAEERGGHGRGKVLNRCGNWPLIGTGGTDSEGRLEEDQVFPSEGLRFPNDKMRSLVRKRAHMGSWRSQEKEVSGRLGECTSYGSTVGLPAIVKCPFEVFFF